MGVMEARRRILLNQPHLIDASGNPISFSTDMAAKMGVKAHFSPVQSGSGDPSPSNVRPISGIQGCNVWRTGGNMFDPQLAISTAYQGANGYVNSNGSLTITSRDQSGNKQRGHITLPPGTYDFYSEFGSGYMSRYTINDSNTETVWYGKKTVAITEQTDFYFRAAMNNSDNYSYPVTGWLQIFKSGETYTEKPYSGASYPVTFPGVGKNLFDIDSLIPGTVDGYGYYIVNNDRRITPYLFIKAGTYTISKENDRQYWKCCKYTLDNKRPSNFVFNDANDVHQFTLSQDCYIRIATDNIPTSASKIQLESGSTATTYEPFTNTIYGGYVDLANGEVWKTWEVVDAADQTWLSNTGILGSWYFNANNPYRDVTTDTPTGRTHIYSNIFKYDSNTYLQNLCVGWGGINNNGNIVVKNESITSLSAWKNYVQNNTVLFGYRIANPVLVATITPIQIKTLRGANTIWSDTNGNVSLKYWKH